VLSTLKTLTIEDCINLTDEEQLIDICTTLTDLTELNLRYYESTDLSAITTLSKLITLDITGSSFEENLSFLTCMTNLQSLDLTNYEILNSTSVGSIAKLTQLTRLIVGMDDENFKSDVKGLSVLTNLRELSTPAFIDYSRFKYLQRATFQYDPKLLDYVAWMPNLKDLSLIDVQFNKKRNFIQYWVHLTRLQIDQFQPRQVIPQLSYLQNLNELSLDSFYNDCRKFELFEPHPPN